MTHVHTKPSCKAQCSLCHNVRNIEDMRYAVYIAQDGIGLVSVWECAKCPTQKRNSVAKVITSVAPKVRKSSGREIRVEIDL